MGEEPGGGKSSGRFRPSSEAEFQENLSSSSSTIQRLIADSMKAWHPARRMCRDNAELQLKSKFPIPLSAFPCRKAI
jgi:hypothetical protein